MIVKFLTKVLAYSRVWKSPSIEGLAGLVNVICENVIVYIPERCDLKNVTLTPARENITIIIGQDPDFPILHSFNSLLVCWVFLPSFCLYITADRAKCQAFFN